MCRPGPHADDPTAPTTSCSPRVTRRPLACVWGPLLSGQHQQQQQRRRPRPGPGAVWRVAIFVVAAAHSDTHAQSCHICCCHSSEPVMAASGRSCCQITRLVMTLLLLLLLLLSLTGCGPVVLPPAPAAAVSAASQASVGFATANMKRLNFVVRNFKKNVN